jgi:hypothetical protein
MGETLYNAGSYALFDYYQNSLKIRLEIRERTSIFQYKPDRRAVRGTLSRREVGFWFLGANMSNNFASLSIVMALLTAAERNQFGSGHTVMRMPLPNNVNLLHGEESYKCAVGIFISREQFKDGGYGMSLGLEAPELSLKCSVTMSILYIHHFKHGLQKAMNWIKPQQGVEVVGVD